MNSKELNRENKNVWNTNTNSSNDRMGACGNNWYLNYFRKIDMLLLKFTLVLMVRMISR
ncbi:hypothetical protein KH5_16390 [Urechidicola sp. KH5]